MICSVCHTEILPGKQVYVLQIDLYAAAGDLVLSEEEMKKDRQKEFEKLMEQLESMDAEAIREETERVFERHVYSLCPICRARFHGLLHDVRSGKESPAKPPADGK